MTYIAVHNAARIEVKVRGSDDTHWLKLAIHGEDGLIQELCIFASAGTEFDTRDQSIIATPIKDEVPA